MQASAALAGLIFVALDQSFADRFIPGLPGRAAESLIMLIGVLVICSVGLVPDISAQAAGLSFAFGGGLDWLAPGAVFHFIASAVNARVLLVEIVRQVQPCAMRRRGMSGISIVPNTQRAGGKCTVTVVP